MTRDLQQDDLLEFSRLVRWLTGVKLTQTDATVELEALAAKYGATEAAPDSDGWIPWAGGKNPAHGRQVEYRMRIGADHQQPADDLRWYHFPGERNSGDIVAYRVIA